MPTDPLLQLTSNSPRAPMRTVIDAFNKSSSSEKAPEWSFGTGSRPALLQPTEGPGPGAYVIKTTLGKLLESHIQSPCQFSLRGRTKFGDPNEKALSKTSANEPGPGLYDLTGKFPRGKTPRATVFPKAIIPRDKSGLGPGPGSYEPLKSLGKQMLSTKPSAPGGMLSKAERPSLVPVGTTDIGPGEYAPPPAACETQVESSKSTCSTLKFGTGYRKGGGLAKPTLMEPSPGPASYTLPGGIATRCKGSPFRDAPAATISGRNKFGSPW